MTKKYTNRLIHETSPYLLQHAHNPVDWYAWGEEALAAAQTQDKPILVSIGYATCHWCHVMERESFENEEVANFMNEHFICIKIDREERPDLDGIYMQACQIFNGSGGWPLNCFLTPTAKPFFAGTYYPPQPAFNRPSWQQVLQNMSNAFRQKREVVEEQAQKLLHMIQQSDTSFVKTSLHPSPPNAAFAQHVYTALLSRADTDNGGFGGAPKFPSTFALQFLLAYHYHTHEAPALQHVEHTLQRMIAGGIYDQLGGGFARYTVDERWQVPHFEKMLYDNALLIGVLADTYKVTRQPRYADVLRQSIAFLQREMMSPEGLFYSAIDADSEGVEGKFYTWTYAELEAVLGEDTPHIAAQLLATREGNWEHTNILWRADDFEATPAVQVALEKLHAARAQRVRPITDDKCLLDWNALQVSALAKAYQATQETAYLAQSLTSAQAILANFVVEGQLYHSYKNGVAKQPAFLDDYAYWIAALWELYHTTSDFAWLQKAHYYTEIVIEQFYDPTDGLFYFTSASQPDAIVRRKEVTDNATPSGNAVIAYCLRKIGVTLDKAHFIKMADRMLAATQEAVLKYPTAFGYWAAHWLTAQYGSKEIAIVGDNAFAKLRELHTHYVPNGIFAASKQTLDDDRQPLLWGKEAAPDAALYVCEHYACQAPVFTVAEVVAGAPMG